MDNKNGALCGHYPSELVVIEGHVKGNEVCVCLHEDKLLSIRDVVLQKVLTQSKGRNVISGVHVICLASVMYILEC